MASRKRLLLLTGAALGVLVASGIAWIVFRGTAASQWIDLEAMASLMVSPEARAPFQIERPSLVVCRYRTQYLECDKTHVRARDVTQEYVHASSFEGGTKRRRLRLCVAWGGERNVRDFLHELIVEANSMGAAALSAELGPPDAAGPDIVTRCCERLSVRGMRSDPNEDMLYASVRIYQYPHWEAPRLLIGLGELAYDANLESYLAQSVPEGRLASLKEDLLRPQESHSTIEVEYGGIRGLSFPSLRALPRSGPPWRLLRTPAGSVIGRGLNSIAFLEGGRRIGGRETFVACDIGEACVLQDGIALSQGGWRDRCVLEMSILDYCRSFGASDPLKP